MFAFCGGQWMKKNVDVVQIILKTKKLIEQQQTNIKKSS